MSETLTITLTKEEWREVVAGEDVDNLFYALLQAQAGENLAAKK